MQPPSATLAEALYPRTGVRQQDLVRELALITGFTVLIALLAQVRIPLGFTPVPITGQTLGVLLTGAALGSRRGAATALLYMFLGGAGVPVFAGWTANPFWAIASGGYIVGFVPAAFVVGWLAERGWDRRPWVLVAMLLGSVAIYVPGLIQLSFFVPDGKVLEYGLLPFIPGDLVKIYAASLLLPVAWTAVPRLTGRR